jgi:plastocyanin
LIYRKAIPMGSEDVRGAFARRSLALFAALVLALAMVACGDDGDDSEEPAAQEEPTAEETTEGAGDLTVTATEYSFDFPATLPAGPASITLENGGEQVHHLILAKLTDDAPPIEDLIELQNPDKFLEEDITGNKPPLAKPGETAPKTIDTELTSGTYGYVCFMPDEEKKQPHAFLGMYGTFEVE